jgi:hypothetical protein
VKTLTRDNMGLNQTQLSSQLAVRPPKVQRSSRNGINTARSSNRHLPRVPLTYLASS